MGPSDYRKPPLTAILPLGWVPVEPPNTDIQRAYLNINGTFVLIGREKFEGKWWLHVSASERHNVPSYEKMMEIKEIFIGTDKKAIMIFPPRSEHVNICVNCLHLYSCDDFHIPDFRKELPNGMIGI